LFTNREVEIAVKTPIALRLLAHLKLGIRAPLRPQLLRRSHFQIRRDERRSLVCCP